MSNNDTELYDLCKAVYEATGWDEGIEYRYWIHVEGNSGEEFIALPQETFDSIHKEVCVAYISDYLLDRLPQGVSVYKEQLAYAYNAGLPKVDRQVADTPLKALLKLTLKLHEQGVLNHE